MMETDRTILDSTGNAIGVGVDAPAGAPHDGEIYFLCDASKGYRWRWLNLKRNRFDESFPWATLAECAEDARQHIAEHRQPEPEPDTDTEPDYMAEYEDYYSACYEACYGEC